jgi:D-glycero-alpha-D-manno-heptose-7-phosphate kinase
MIISRTPFRISFFGGGTDYPDWYLENDGAVLSTSFDKYCYITCRALPPFFEHNYRIAYSIVENAINISDIRHPAVRGILGEMKFEHGLEIHADADLPARSGLGSSSSFIVGLLNALYALEGRRLSQSFLAHEAIRIEQEVIKENVGSQDQVAAAYGGFNLIHFQRNGQVRVEPVIITSQRKNLLNEHLMLFFTGFSRIASDIAEDQIRNISSRANELRNIRSMVDQALSILAGESDLRDFGELLHESWLCKQSLSVKISNEEINEIYRVARNAGAIGGKLLGAGGGGFMLLFVEPHKQLEVRNALNKLVYVPFKFESSGSQIIHYEP